MLLTFDRMGKRIKGGRHLHEILNESIIFMSHFSIGMIEMAAVAGVQKQKKFSGIEYSKKNFCNHL